MRQSFRQSQVEPPDKYLCAAHAAVNAQDNFATSRHREAIRMIESVAGNVQVTVAAVRFQALEAEQTVIRARNQRGDLGGSHLDQPAVGREDNGA
jgi:hypothetical protein